MSINNWRVYCVDEGDWINTQSIEEPTECPNNAGHTIRSVQILDNIDNFIFLGEETEINESIQGGFGIKYKKSGADKYAGIMFDANTEKFNFYKGNDTMPIIGVTGDIDNGIIDIDTFNSIDHTELANRGTNTHAQIDTHIEDGQVHFTKASISHTEIQDIGTTYTHDDIDVHIDDSGIHFTETSINHANIQNIGTNTHAQIDSHIADTTIHYPKNSISHTEIQDIGSNTHTQIDTHIDNSGIHFTESSINHANIQNVGTNTHAQIDSHIADGTIHFTKGSISHTEIQDIGSNTHAQIDAHIGNTSTHFTKASISHTEIQDIGTNTHSQIDTHIDSTSNPHDVTLNQITPTTTKGDILVESGTQDVIRIPVGSDGAVLTANSTTISGLQWKEITETGNYSYFPIWAEENSSLGNNAYEWAYGNGANTDVNGGIVIPVNCELFAISWAVKATGGEISVEINGVNSGTSDTITATRGYRTFTPVEINAGDRCNFKTITGSSNQPNTVAAWFRIQVTAFGGGLGEITTVSNIGSGVGVYKQKVDEDLEFKTINNRDGISITDDTTNNEVDIGLDLNNLTQDVSPQGASDFLVTYDSSSGSHKKVLINDLPVNVTPGETNTASNVNNGGVGVFKQKSGVDLQFRGINSSNLSVLLDSGNNEIDIELDIDALSEHSSNSSSISNNNDLFVVYNKSQNKHKKLKAKNLNISGSLTASNVNIGGLGFFKQKSGSTLEFRGLNNITHSGLSLSLDNTNNEIDIGLDINSLVNDSNPDGSNDYLVSYDASTGLHKKVLINNLPSNSSGVSVAKIYDKKANGCNGGDFNSGGWYTRNLNTLEQTGSFVTGLSSDCFTLTAGTYIVKIKAPAYDVNDHKIRLYNHTSNSVEIYGANSTADNSNNDTCFAFLDGFFTIGTSSLFSVEHRCDSYESGDGFGRATGFGVDEIYTTVLLTKIG